MRVREMFSRIKNKWAGFKQALSYRQKIALVSLLGIIVGSGGLFMYLLRMHTYIIGDDPKACINCHIMSPYYATWSHSSHARNATCNDCHVPNGTILSHYLFKGKDGMKHVAYFVTKSERQTIMAEEASAEVIMDNCIRCHKQLNTEFVKTGRIICRPAAPQSGSSMVAEDVRPRSCPQSALANLLIVITNTQRKAPPTEQ